MNDLELLYKYLLSDNIKEYEEDIFRIIPELIFEKEFDQKSEWHCYDVWDHTIATINACDKNEVDRLILLLHDIGKPFSYQDDGDIRHFKNHANVSAKMSVDILNRLGVDKSIIHDILKLIEMHSIKIDGNIINDDNKDFYERLLKIKRCDAYGYEESHAKMILEELDNIKLDRNL